MMVLYNSNLVRNLLREMKLIKLQYQLHSQKNHVSMIRIFEHILQP